MTTKRHRRKRGQAKVSQYVWHLEYFRAPPTEDHGCYEAQWSYGKACNECWVECELKGWSQQRVHAQWDRRFREAQETRATQ